MKNDKENTGLLVKKKFFRIVRVYFEKKAACILVYPNNEIII